jgi:Tfp pilus assembly protein PilX
LSSAREKSHTRSSNQRGMALVVVMLVLLILTTLAAALIYATQTEVQTSGNYKLVTQARYMAEAGSQSTITWLTNGYTSPANFASYDTTKSPVQYASNPVILSAMTGKSSNYPDATVQAAFNTALNAKSVPGVAGASYSTYATLLSMTPASGVSWLGGGGVLQSWQITSSGSISGIRAANVQLQTTYENSGTPVAPLAVFATSASCPAITMTGGAKTDSYDSSGSYAATVQSTSGDLGTNGTLSVSGGSTIINGTAYLQTVTTGGCPATFSNSVGPGVVQATVAMGGPRTFADPVYTNPSPALTASTNYNANQTLPPGNYSNIKVTGGKTLTLSPGTYNFNSLTLTGGSDITVNPPGQVVLEIAGAGSPSNALDLSGGSVVNGGGVLANFQIVYNGTGSINLSGGANSAAVVYAPNSPVSLTGGSPWFGAIVGNTFTDTGGAAVHFDRALLKNVQTVGPFVPVSFNWMKY